jgi:hypothetical protein
MKLLKLNVIDFFLLKKWHVTINCVTGSTRKTYLSMEGEWIIFLNNPMDYGKDTLTIFKFKIVITNWL